MLTELPGKLKRIGIAADHGGYELKEYLAEKLREVGHQVVDFGDDRPKEEDDYPDFIVPVAHAVAAGTVDRQIVYLENTAMFVQIAEGMGIRGLLHTDYQSTCKKFASLGLSLD